jgi:O-antigen/teichoic acid export membrane protein
MAAPTLPGRIAGSEMGKAIGLAGAMIANNVIALGATIVFARLLSDSHGGGYGSLAALISYFLILSVFGQALQVATAREGVLGHLGVGAELVATADAVGVRDDQWAAALGLPAAGLWLWLSTLAGTLQGIGQYRDVSVSIIGQQAVRLPIGALLAAAGLGVFGAFAGSLVAFMAMGAWCLWRIRRYGELTEAATVRAPPTAPVETDPEARRLLVHLRRAWAPIIGLIVIAVLQNIDIIAAKHRFSTSMATSYGAVAVAAKVLIWVAMGAGFYLVPEVSRRRASGDDPRPILARALGIVAVCAVPVLLLFAFASHLLIRVGFGTDHAGASGSLLVLGLAFTALAATYIAVQYLLALHHTWFLAPLALVAIAEPILLLHASRRPTGFATVVLGVQIAGAVVAYGCALRVDRGGTGSPRTGPSGAPANRQVQEGPPERLPQPQV